MIEPNYYSTIITRPELNMLMQESNPLIIDVRFSLGDTEKGRRDYLVSHIPGAIYAHLDEDLSGTIIPGKTGRHPLPPDEKMKKLFSAWGVTKERQVVIYDDSHGGVAARLWWMLQYCGHPHAAVLEQGWKGWIDSGLPVDSEIPVPIQSDFEIFPNIHMIFSAEEVQRAIETRACKLVDARLAERYRGEEEPIDPIAGHIPTAHNFPFFGNLDEEHKWLSVEKLRERFSPIFINDADLPVVCYCGSGVTACHDVLAMRHAGFPFVKLYPGSWSEWITNPDHPIA